MRRFITNALLVGIVCGGILAALTGRPVAAADAEEQAVLQANKALEQALEKADKAAVGRLLDADFTWIYSDGIIQTKEEVLANLPKPAAIGGGDAEATARTYGKVAVVQVHAGNVHVLRVWVKRPAIWRVLHINEVTQPARVEPAGPGIEAPCVNPCETVPFKPTSAAAQAILSSWQAMEIGAASHDGNVWGARAADEWSAIQSWSSRPLTKEDEVARFNKLRQDGVRTNPVAPLVWAHMWDFGNTAFMLSEHTPYGGKPDVASRVWVNREGQWLMVVAYHTTIHAMPALTFTTTGRRNDDH